MSAANKGAILEAADNSNARLASSVALMLLASWRAAVLAEACTALVRTISAWSRSHMVCCHLARQHWRRTAPGTATVPKLGNREQPFASRSRISPQQGRSVSPPAIQGFASSWKSRKCRFRNCYKDTRSSWVNEKFNKSGAKPSSRGY